MNSVVGGVVMEAEFADCWAKDTFLAHLSVEVTKNDFYIVTGSAF